MMSNPLTDSCSNAYLAAMTFWMQKSVRPTLLTYENYLAVSVEFCRGLTLSLLSVCRTFFSGNIIASVICSTCRKCPLSLDVPFSLRSFTDLRGESVRLLLPSASGMPWRGQKEGYRKQVFS